MHCHRIDPPHLVQRTAARFDPATGDGIIVLQTGNPTFASRIAGHWTFWHTGRVDSFAFLFSIGDTLTLLVVGAILIVAGAFAVGWRR